MPLWSDLRLYSLMNFSSKAFIVGVGASTVSATWPCMPLAASPASSIVFWLISVASPTMGLA